MIIYEIGTGYTPIPAQMGAATEIVVEELAKAFLKKGQSVQVVDIATENRALHNLPLLEVPVPKCFRRADLRLGLMHKLKRVAYSISLARTLRSILKNSPEKVILHFHNQYNLFFFLKLIPRHLREKAVIAYTNHSGIWRLPWNEIENTIRRRYFQELKSMKEADVVFVLNQGTRQNVIEHLGIEERKIHIVKNGVNTDVYRPLRDLEKQATKKILGLGGKIIILQVGSVNVNKGQLRTAQGLLPLLRSRKDVVFAYVGGIVEEEYHKQVERFAEENGVQDQVCYLGMAAPGEELNRVYNCAEATICASQYEGFSLVLIESLSCGVPVLVEETSGFYVGEGCIEYRADDIAATVERLISVQNNYRVIATAARENAIIHYGWDSVAEVLLRYWEQPVPKG